MNHRFALSHPALVSAPSKKSFSSVSSPILACSDFTSTAGVAGVPPPGPKISEALASSCDFHVVIWLGCTSKCSASWAMVRSPLTAARATFALKAAEWFRRGRLLMVSPVHGDYRHCQAEIPLIVLSKFPEPAQTALSVRRSQNSPANRRGERQALRYRKGLWGATLCTQRSAISRAVAFAIN